MCFFFSFLSYRRPGLCTAAAFFFYFRAIGEAACLRHRLMFASRNVDVSSSSTLFFNLTTIHPLSSFTLTISEFFSSPLFPPSLARNTSGPSRLSCYEKLRSSFLINALWNRAELKVSLKSMHTYILTLPAFQSNCLQVARLVIVRDCQAPILLYRGIKEQRGRSNFQHYDVPTLVANNFWIVQILITKSFD